MFRILEFEKKVFLKGKKIGWATNW